MSGCASLPNKSDVPFCIAYAPAHAGSAAFAISVINTELVAGVIANNDKYYYLCSRDSPSDMPFCDVYSSFDLSHRWDEVVDTDIDFARTVFGNHQKFGVLCSGEW